MISIYCIFKLGVSLLNKKENNDFVLIKMLFGRAFFFN